MRYVVGQCYLLTFVLPCYVGDGRLIGLLYVYALVDNVYMQFVDLDCD